MEISEWLAKLGMSEYAQRFAENDIDSTILSDLTDQDLEKIGVVSLGHRRKLLRAIGELGNAQAPAKSPPVSTPPSTPPTSAASETSAERRQVTVLFSDLVGSTALSARMDPEDLREVISAYQKAVAATVERFGGFLAKYMGDGVLVYFGYPQAHEDDAERAVRGGLALIEAVGGLKSGASLQTRVGIATVKGIAAPVRAWTALRPSRVESRFEALHASGLTELVGRDEELELLLRRWSKAKNGDGQVVLLSGEAGIGKSRLTAALFDRLANEPHTRLRYFCSPQHTGSALYPIIGHMERAAELVHGDTAQEKLDKLDALLAQTSTSKRDAALLAEMLSLPNDGRYPALDLEPQQRRQKTLEALTAQVEALSRQNPLLMIFEDAHWTDPTSLETFGRVVDRVRSRGCC
jgi:class 3 adenylate cyclase